MEFYVINYSWNKKKTEMFNIFDNWPMREDVEKAVHKYLRSPKKYEYEGLTGFDALCKYIDRSIAWQERGRREYEICAGDHFTAEIHDVLREIDKYDNIDEFKKYLETLCKRTARLNRWDCWEQAHANIEVITRECIRAVKEKKHALDQK